MKEIWKDIKDYEGLYQVSNLGRVRSLRYHNTTEIKVLNQFKANKRYLFVSLSKNNINTKKTVHRLVAQTFIHNPFKLNEVNHIDGNKENNCVKNLEWCTHKENMQHAVKMGLR